MRPIEFRAKAKEPSKCNFVEDNGFVFGGIAFDGCTDVTYITRWNSFGLGFIENIEVVQDTVGQFTGLYDKAGKPIYEGDVITAIYDGENQFDGVVQYDNGAFIVKEDEESQGACMEYLTCENMEFVIDGNVHDNPELLK